MRGLARSEEHTSELQSRQYLVCRLLLEKKKDSCKTTTHLTKPECRTRCSTNTALRRSTCQCHAVYDVEVSYRKPCFDVCFFFFNERAPTVLFLLPLPGALRI